eukprot:353303-Chlamydomonas_euryale.AAC.3
MLTTRGPGCTTRASAFLARPSFSHAEAAEGVGRLWWERFVTQPPAPAARVRVSPVWQAMRPVWLGHTLRQGRAARPFSLSPLPFPPASPTLAAAHAGAVAVAKRLALVPFRTSVTDQARTAGAAGSLADFSVDHPFLCRRASQLQVNGPTPGQEPTPAVPAPASRRRRWPAWGRPRRHHDSHRWCCRR